MAGKRRTTPRVDPTADRSRAALERIAADTQDLAAWANDQRGKLRVEFEKAILTGERQAKQIEAMQNEIRTRSAALAKCQADLQDAQADANAAEKRVRAELSGEIKELEDQVATLCKSLSDANEHIRRLDNDPPRQGLIARILNR